jgi:CDP-diacylglycerol--glycerol-3-phosphate 3-phosphatidyltransferase
MFASWLVDLARRSAERIVTPLARFGVSPNALTLAGFVLNLLTAAVIAAGHLTWGGALVLLSGAFDMLDGALARVAQKNTVFGAFFDSTVDRISEAALFFGVLLYYYQHGGSLLELTLTYVAVIGSLMVSYARARAEGLGLECKVGLFQRPERVVALGMGLLLGRPVLDVAIAALAVISSITVVQRIAHIWRSAP